MNAQPHIGHTPWHTFERGEFWIQPIKSIPKLDWDELIKIYILESTRNRDVSWGWCFVFRLGLCDRYSQYKRKLLSEGCNYSFEGPYSTGFWDFLCFSFSTFIGVFRFLFWWFPGILVWIFLNFSGFHGIFSGEVYGIFIIYFSRSSELNPRTRIGTSPDEVERWRSTTFGIIEAAWDIEVNIYMIYCQVIYS